MTTTTQISFICFTIICFFFAQLLTNARLERRIDALEKTVKNLTADPRL